MNKIVAALSALLLMFCFTACGDYDKAESTSKDHAVLAAAEAISLDGKWSLAEPTSDFDMVATVKNRTITIFLVTTDMKGLYWKGTFDAPKNVTDGTKIESHANTSALESSLFGSQEPSKTFVYDDNQLSYVFGISGVKKTVYLQR